jgi:hypothetical protein
MRSWESSILAPRRRLALASSHPAANYLHAEQPRPSVTRNSRRASGRGRLGVEPRLVSASASFLC